MSSVSSDNYDSSSSLDENTDSGVNIESDNVYEMAGPYLYEPGALDLASERGDQSDNCEQERLTGLSRLDVNYTTQMSYSRCAAFHQCSTHLLLSGTWKVLLV